MNPQTAVKQTGGIIQARWPEVVLMLALHVGLAFLLERMMSLGQAQASHQGTIPEWAFFILGVGIAVLAIVWQMLYLGFLRTGALDGDAPHEPMTLVVTGRRFFWRFLGVQLVIGVLIWSVAGLSAGLVGSLFGYRDVTAYPQWLLELTGVGAIAVFIKPFFLIPAYIVALDISVIEAFWRMRQFRLGDLGAVCKAYVIGLTSVAAVVVIAALASRGTTGYYIAAGISYLIQSLMVLVLMLATVLVLTPEAELSTEAEETES